MRQTKHARARGIDGACWCCFRRPSVVVHVYVSIVVVTIEEDNEVEVDKDIATTAALLVISLRGPRSIRSGR
jgi:hypothetical protein